MIIIRRKKVQEAAHEQIERRRRANGETLFVACDAKGRFRIQCEWAARQHADKNVFEVRAFSGSFVVFVTGAGSWSRGRRINNSRLAVSWGFQCTPLQTKAPVVQPALVDISESER